MVRYVGPKLGGHFLPTIHRSFFEMSLNGLKRTVCGGLKSKIKFYMCWVIPELKHTSIYVVWQLAYSNGATGLY
jgi:hypothetical protein